jgi:hypothetical protein
MALVMAEIGVDYKMADLITCIIKRVKELKGEYTIKDSIAIFYKWKEDWEKYDETQKKSEIKSKSKNKN